MKKKKPKIVSSEEIYKDPWVRFRKDTVKFSDDKIKKYGIMEYGDGSSIVALDKKLNVYLTREYHHGEKGYALELPSGAMKKGETPLACAKRELEEETGASSSQWISLGHFFPITGAADHKSYSFLAIDIKEGKAHPDEGEVLDIIKIPFKKAYEIILNSEIVHSGTIVAILKAYKYLKDKRSIDF